MTLVSLATGLDITHLAPSDLLAEGAGILVLLAAAILVYRTVREGYLLVWIFGWLLYLVYHEALFIASKTPYERPLTAIAHGAFMVAVGCFVASVLLYTNARKYLPAIGLLCAIAVDVAVVRSLWFPNSEGLLIAVQLLYRAMTLIGALRLALFSRGRHELGVWSLTVMLLFLHMDESIRNPHYLSGTDAAVEIMLGLSMILVVLDEMRGRAKRLAVVTAITSSLAEAREPAVMIASVLAELKEHSRAQAVWFRAIEDDHMVMRAHLGLSEEFVSMRRDLTAEDSYSARLIQDRLAARLRVQAMDGLAKQALQEEGFDHLVMVPVSGKSQPLGVLTLGIAHRRSYTPDEMQFLTTTAHEVGIAIENLRMLEQLVRSQRQWASTFDSIDDQILVHDPEGRIMRVNRALGFKLGRSVNDIIGRSAAEVLPNSANGCPYCRRSGEMSVEGPDPVFGGYSLVSTSSYTEGGGTSIGTVHVITDTTAQRAAEERYRLLFEEAQEGVFISTPQGRLLDCNEAFVRLLGYGSRAEVLNLDITTQVYGAPDDRRKFIAEMNARGYVKNHEVVLRRKDGSTATLLENSFASRNSLGEIERYQGFLVDITEKKRAEEEIRRRNRELHALNAIAVIATQSFDLDEILNITLRQVVELFAAEIGSIWIFDAETHTMRRRAARGHKGEIPVQDRVFEITDAIRKDLMSSKPEILTRVDLPRMPEKVHEYLEEEGLGDFLWVMMWSQEKPVGIIGVSERKAREFSSTEENLMVAIARQLATTVEKVRLYEETSRAYEDLRRTQEQLLQSEKMSAMGQLISGVAHELNNPLTAILGYSQLLEAEQLQERARDFTGKLYRQAQRTHRLVQNLLSFARQRKPVKQYVDVRRVLEDTLALRDYDLKLNNVKVTRDYQEVAQVYGDPHQLEQVFLNIINNAADAMLETAKSGNIDVRVYSAGDGAIIEFHDSGPGIKEVSRIFDPFYTTKKVGKGTGLGLSICYGIVKEHGGDIVAVNHESGGAVFRIRIPFANMSRKLDSNPMADPSHAVLTGRMLLIEHEESILEFEREVLSGAGAEVVSVSNGTEAIERLQKDNFDVIVMDATIPGSWHSTEIYQWIAKNRPGIEKRVVLTLSHVDDPGLRQFIDSNNVITLVKPFAVVDLLREVKQAMLSRARAESV